jgi:hypothetical protein
MPQPITASAIHPNGESFGNVQAAMTAGNIK